jgi:DNA recombination protein RmuC
MDSPTVLIATIALAVMAAVLVLLSGLRAEQKRSREAAEKLARELTQAQAGLAGRFQQLSASHIASQAQLIRSIENTEKTGKTMSEIHQRLAVIDRAQKSLTELSEQVVGLQDILSNRQARGAFGEIQLNDLVSSILPPSAYDFQATLSNAKRADCLIRLPNPPGPIVIDSKFPLESYYALRAANDDKEIKAALRTLGTDIMNHVRQIADKYIIPGETAESALMFLPSEAVYAELHASLPDIVEKSYRARVWIVSPTTLMATLNTVRAVLKDVQMREQAGRIQVEVEKMFEDIRRLDVRVGNLQNHFRQAEDDMRQIRISTDKVTRRSETIGEVRFEENASDEIAPPVQKIEGGE